jgi:hypothetical protein
MTGEGFEACFLGFFIQQRSGCALALPVSGLAALHVGEFVFNLDESQSALLLGGVVGMTVGFTILILGAHVLQIPNFLA